MLWLERSVSDSPLDQVQSKPFLHRAIEWPAIISPSVLGTYIEGRYLLHLLPITMHSGANVLRMHVLKVFTYSPTQSLSTRASVLPTQTPLPDFFLSRCEVC